MEKLKSKVKTQKGRIWELDFLKGIALIFMIWDHIVFDLYGFFGIDTSSLGFFQEGIGVISSVIFMTVCGVSVTLGRHNIKHGLTVFSLAAALTLFTYIFDLIASAGALILFGILHFLGLAMIIGHFAKKLPLYSLVILAAGSFALGMWFRTLTVSVPFLFPFGLVTEGFYSSDYFPLLPNLSYVFLGIIIGKTVYKEKKSLFHSDLSGNPLCFLGRHTLVLYFVHQPVVMGVLYIVIKLINAG